MFDIDRKTASKLLKLSLRTIDRYIARKKLSSEARNGRVWLNKEEIMKLRRSNNIDRRQTVSTGHLSHDNIDVIPVDMSTDSENQNDGFSANKNDFVHDDVYRKLFEQLQEELKEKQSRLEAANYRVGQLESKLKETVPLLDYNRAMAVEKSEKQQLKKHLDAKEFETEELLNSLKEEKLNKKIYLILLFILLLLQPLWFLFPAK